MLVQPVQRQRIADICRRYGVLRLQMFGSAARGDETPASDVDLLVEFTPGQAPTGFALVDLQDELSSVFDGRPVDLAFPSVLDNPYRRRAIVPELMPLFQCVSIGCPHTCMTCAGSCASCARCWRRWTWMRSLAIA